MTELKSRRSPRSLRASKVTMPGEGHKAIRLDGGSDATELQPDVQPVPEALQPFRPAQLLAGPHLQTMLGRILRSRPALKLVRERWDTPDGDFVDVDLTTELSEGEGPIVVIFHGLEGSSRRSYVRLLMRSLGVLGIGSVGLNFRGCSGAVNRLGRAYHSGDSDEAAWVAARVAARWPGRPLGATGFSLGGNLLLKYLGESGERSLFGAAAVASVPFDLAEAQRKISGPGLQRVYAQYFLRSLKQKIRAKEGLLADGILRAGLKARSLAEFDDAVTAPLHGFRNAAHYYETSSSKQFLESIAVPTLVLHSLDDPFLPGSAVPTAQFAQNPLLFPMLTKRGGHLGFFAGSPKNPQWWGEQALAVFLASALKPQ